MPKQLVAFFKKFSIFDNSLMPKCPSLAIAHGNPLGQSVKSHITRFRHHEKFHCYGKPQMSNKIKDFNIAVIMFDGGEEQDIVGCWEMFSWATEYDDLPEDEEVTEANFAYTFNKAGGMGQSQPDLFTVAHTTSPMVMSSGMKFVADYTFDNTPAANVIGVPGSEGARAIEKLKEYGTIDYIRRVGTQEDIKYVLSVCTGSFVLGAAGLLDEVNCTVYMNQSVLPQASRNAC